MPSVVVGSVGEQVVVPTDACVKSGIETDERIIIRGSTTPAWVHVLLLFTLIGWLFAGSMTSRRYRIEVPFRHALYHRWLVLQRLAWGVGSVSVFAAIWAASVDPLLGTLAAVVLGMANTLVNNVGVHQDRAERLVLTRVHRSAVAAIMRRDLRTRA